MAATAVSPTLTCSVLCQGNKPTVAVAHPWRAAPSPAFLSPAKVLFHPTAHLRRSRGCPLSFTRARLGCRLRAAAGDAGRTRPSSAEGTTTPEHVEAEPACEHPHAPAKHHKSQPSFTLITSPVLLPSEIALATSSRAGRLAHFFFYFIRPD
jgi:hypothetical protein